MATVFRRKGRAAWFYKVRLAAGRWETRVGYRDRRATEQKAGDDQQAIDRGAVGLVDPHAEHLRRPIAEHVEDFAAALRGRDRTAKHVRMTRRRLERAIAEAGWATIADMDLGAAERFLGQLLDEGQAARTRDHYSATLAEFSGWLVNSDRLPRDPFRRLQRHVANPGNVRRERQALTGEQVQRLVAAAEQRPVQRWRETHPQATAAELAALARDGRRRGLLYQFAALTGLRRSECAGLRWADVDLGEQPVVHPRASTTKNRRSEPLPLDAELARLLRAHRAELAQEAGGLPRPTSPLFRLPKNLPEQIRKDAEFAGIELQDGRVLDFHSLRATAATLLATAGVPLQQARRLIRHTDPKLTARHYEKVATETLRGAVDQVAATFWGVAPTVAPNSAPERAAVGCSVPLAQAGDAMARRLQVTSERHAAPFDAAACRSVPLSLSGAGVVEAAGIEPASQDTPS